MKIAQVLIQASGPFQDFQIDLSYPEGHPKAGKPLDKVCLIGPNGSGKSSLFKILSGFLRDTLRFRSKGLFLVKLQLGERMIYSVHINNNALLFQDSIDTEPMWMFELIRDGAFTMAFNRNYEKYCIGHEEEPELYDELWFDNNSDDLLLFRPADFARDQSLGLVDVPAVKVHEMESLAENFPYFNEISPAKVNDCWAMISYLFYRREQDFKKFSERPENKGKPENLLKMLFDNAHPDILPSLEKAWKPILDSLGLELDLENASPPGHLRDKLIVQLRKKGSKSKVEFGDLGTGMRRLLFETAQVWALCFDREINHGFVFLEEPESQLHPAWVERILPMYLEQLPESQLFLSTHSPLVAAQFDPAERLILSLDEKGNPQLRRSECAADASIAEILASDFR